MDKVDFLIVGQGIAGILTAYSLIRQGKKVTVIDNEDLESASHKAGALLNPVNLNTGKPFPNQQTEFDIALNTYQAIEQYLNIHFINPCPLLVLKPSPSLKENKHLHDCSKSQWQHLHQNFQEIDHACIIENTYHVHFDILKSAWKDHLNKQGKWIKETFDYAQCQITESEVIYKNVAAKNIIFCEGAQGRHNPFFPKLPFNRNMGNILELKIEGLTANFGYQIESIKLLPLGQNAFWLGSNYVWDFEEVRPDSNWQKKQIKLLEKYLKLPFELRHHYAAERPTTAGQQSLLLQHDNYPQLYFINGFGTRGFSRGPALIMEFITNYELRIKN